jgi:hypothetical protein
MRSCLNSLLPPFVVSEVGKNKLLQALLSQFFFDSLHERASIFFAPVRAKLIRKTDSFDVPASPSAHLRGWH